MCIQNCTPGTCIHEEAGWQAPDPLRAELLATLRAMSDAGLNVGTAGNASVRLSRSEEQADGSQVERSDENTPSHLQAQAGAASTAARASPPSDREAHPSASRVHMLMGIMSYVSSPLWLLFLLNLLPIPGLNGYGILEPSLSYQTRRSLDQLKPLGMLLLFSRTPIEETIPALGILGFGIPYFALPIAAGVFEPSLGLVLRPASRVLRTISWFSLLLLVIYLMNTLFLYLYGH